MTIALRPYQEQTIDHIIAHPRTNLFVPMGAGKTVSVLTALDMLTVLEDPFPALVVAPLRVANSTWPDEVKKWPHLRHLRVSVVTGTPGERTRALAASADVYCTNYDNLTWLAESLGKWPFKTIVADEATRLKGFRTRQGTKRARSLALHAFKSTRYIGLTGTPAANGLADLWGITWFLDKGERLGTSYKAFTDRWFQIIGTAANFNLIKPLPYAQREIEDRLKDICLSIDLKEYIDLKEPVVNTIEVELPKRAREIYRSMEKEMFAEIRKGKDIAAFTAATKTMKCLQLCLAAGTQVLTSRGWVAIENITSSDRVWDGSTFVNCSGSVYKGVQQTILVAGVYLTPEHKLRSTAGWVEAKEFIHADASERPHRYDVRLPYGYRASGDQEPAGHVVVPLRVRECSGTDRRQPDECSEGQRAKELRVQARLVEPLPRDDQQPSVPYLVEHETALPKPNGQRLQKLWRSGHLGVRSVVAFVRTFLDGYVSRVLGDAYSRPDRQRRKLRARELPLGFGEGAKQQHPAEYRSHDACRGDDSRAGGSALRSEAGHVVRQVEERVAIGAGFRHTYDILDCGPNHCFAIRGNGGEITLAHNCNGAVYVDEHGAWEAIHDAKLDALESVIEEANGAPVLVAYHFKSDLARLQKRFRSGRVLDTDPKTIRDWNAGKIPVLFAHPASAGHGISLQDGGNIIAFFSLNWNLEERLQIIERIGPARQAQSGHDRPVFIHNIIAKETVDELVLQRVEGKREVVDLIMEAMRK